MLPPILTWRHMVIPLKHPDKGFRILVPQPGADIRHAHLGQ